MKAGENPMNGGDGMTNAVLEQFTTMIGEWIPEEAALAVAAGGKYVHFNGKGHRIPLAAGAPVEPGSIAHRVLKERKRTEAYLDGSDEIPPYYGIGYPVEVGEEPGAVVVLLPPGWRPPGEDPVRFLTGRQDDEWVPVPVGKITHIESADKKTWFYLDGEAYSTTQTLKQLETVLPESFHRIHRSYLVNTDAIVRIRKDFTGNLLVETTDGEELPVSQTYASALRGTFGF
ncbi:LytTR family DNA-binding domain-containing protein [Bhargavaea cecembensis]|uniref:LytTR family DNA-binding domain-containing protein n=1 Tax=Bhargavaea cecembensis TaxID=394098 RepID=UPI0015CF07A0|nr:LytTR family DNA-binding domain-containing protein [Bhargavaea cecembensis]